MPSNPKTTAFRVSSRDGIPHPFSLAEPVWSLTEPASMSGAILVERLRTFGGRLLDPWPNHNRLRAGADFMGWDSTPVVAAFDQLVQVVVNANQSKVLRSEDVSIVVLFTPKGDDTWEAWGHVTPIPFARWKGWYRDGVRLRTTDVCVGEATSVPTAIKHRSRLHYWAADRKASKMEEGAIALLATGRGEVSDTSLANLIVIDGEGKWLTPSHELCHQGTTLVRTRAMLAEEGIEIVDRRITVEELIGAREAMVVGSTGIVAPVDRVNGRQIADGMASRDGWRLVADRWQGLVGMDFLTGF